MVRIKRVYEKASDDDGIRVLVDRLWPRGVKKEDLKIDRWANELAPSNAVRKEFCHDPEKWQAFRKAYLAELQGHKEEIAELREIARNETLTLLYAAKDETLNNAVVLLDAIQR